VVNDMFGSSSPQSVLAAHAASHGQKPAWHEGTMRSPGIDVPAAGAAWQPQAAMTREDASQLVAAKIRGSPGAAAAAERRSGSLQRDSSMQSSLWSMDVEQPQSSQSTSAAALAAPAPEPEPEPAPVGLLASPATPAPAEDLLVPGLQPPDQWVDRWVSVTSNPPLHVTNGSILTDCF